MAPDTMSGKYTQAIHELATLYDANQERIANGLAPYSMNADGEARVVDYTRYLKSQMGKHGKVTPDIPKGWEEYDLATHPTYYKAFSLNERVVNEAVAKNMTDLQIPMDKITKIMGRGVDRKALLPTEVVRTLKSVGFGKDDPVGELVKQITRKALGLGKGFLIYGPQNYVQQFIRNGVGDTLRILRNAPGSVATISEGKVKSAWLQAMKEVVANELFLKPASDSLREFDELGGEQAQHYRSEGMLPAHPLSPLFKHIQKAGPPANASAREKIAHQLNQKVASPIKQLGSTAYWLYMLPHTAREKIGRYAVYLYVRDHALKHGRPPIIGMAKAEQALAIRDPRRQAFFIADHTVGSYRKRTAGARYLRQFIYPFISFKEINRTGEYQGLKNALRAADVRASLGRKMIGEDLFKKALGEGPGGQASAKVTNGLTTFGYLAGAGVATAITAVVGYLVHKKEWEILKERMPWWNIPMIAGKQDEKSGDIRTYRGLDPFRDLMNEWVGLDVLGDDWQDLHNGRKSWQEVAMDMSVKNWGNQMYQQLNPILKWKSLGGMNDFPSVWDAKPATDPKLLVMDNMGLGALYRKVSDMPQKRGYWQKVMTGQNTVNPMEISYYQAIDNAKEWQMRVGKAMPQIGGGPTDDPQVMALYKMKQAVRMGDRNGAKEALWNYARASKDRAEGKAGGGLKTFQSSLLGLEPLRGIADKDLGAYLAQLKPDEALTLRRGYLFYHNLVAPEVKTEAREKTSTRSFVRWMRGRMHDEIMRGGFTVGLPERGMLMQTLKHNELNARKRLSMQKDDSGAAAMSQADLEKANGE
jgi:hypothetical protein